jgi:hypothetical protein
MAMATATSFLASIPTAPADTWLCWCGYVNFPGEPCGRCYHEPPDAGRHERGGTVVTAVGMASVLALLLGAIASFAH